MKGIKNFYYLLFLTISAMSASCSKNPLEPLFNQSFREQDSCGFVQNVYGERVVWNKNRLPIKLHIHQSVPREYIPNIEAAVDGWNQLIQKKLFVIHSYSYVDSQWARQDQTNVIYWETTWPSSSEKNGIEQARTSIYFVGNEIIESDIRINAKNFQYYPPQQNSFSVKSIHLESLMIHELGHVLGLKHIDYDDPSHIMNFRLPSFYERTKFSDFEYKALSCAY